MNIANVHATAARHYDQIEAARIAAEGRPGPAPGAIFERDFPDLILALDSEATQYCAAYNEGFGFTKLVTHDDEANINVELDGSEGTAARLQFFLERHRVAYCGIEIDGERSELNVAVVERESGLALTLDDRDVTPEQMITILLDRFTEELTRAECSGL